jgi:hypothetical protein
VRAFPVRAVTQRAAVWLGSGAGASVELSMTYRHLVTIGSPVAALAMAVACDQPVQAVEETPAAAPAQAEASMVAESRVDLQAVVDRVASGEVVSAAELETELEADAIAHVDIDVDGKRDELRIVERRVDKTAVFEIRALPSSKAEVTVETAPVVAELEVEAQADAGTAVARASFTASFVASAELHETKTVEHRFTGVSVSSEGRMHVEADANVFVAWAFRAGRPVYVAEVFVIHEVEHEPDPCWPPGHCKHGFWKATGDRLPGHDKRHDGDATFARGHKPTKGELDRIAADKHPSKPSKSDRDDDRDHGKSHAKSNKSDKGKSDKGKGGKGGKGK